MGFEYPTRTVPDTMSKKDKEAVCKKIGHLIREGKPPKQAAGAAYGMKRAGKLTKEGKYKKS